MYPVTIDPTFTLQATGDAWVTSGSGRRPADWASVLRVGSMSASTTYARSFMNFDDSAWSGAHVLSASLQTTRLSGSSCTTTPMRVSRVTAPWSLTGLTWANQPSAATLSTADYADYVAGTAPGSCPMTASWDITQIAQGWASGDSANYGLRFAAAPESSSAGLQLYAS